MVCSSLATDHSWNSPWPIFAASTRRTPPIHWRRCSGLHLSAGWLALIGLIRSRSARLSRASGSRSVILGSCSMRRACTHRPRRTLAGTEAGRETEGFDLARAGNSVVPGPNRVQSATPRLGNCEHRLTPREAPTIVPITANRLGQLDRNVEHVVDPGSLAFALLHDREPIPDGSRLRWHSPGQGKIKNASVPFVIDAPYLLPADMERGHARGNILLNDDRQHCMVC